MKRTIPYRGRPPKPVLPLTQDADRELLRWMILGYMMLLGLGFLVLRLPGTMVRGNELNVDRAIFTAINAGTLTGFQQDIGIGQFNPANQIGPAVLLLLTLGGSLFSLLAGGLAAVRILRLPYTDKQVGVFALGAVTLAMFAGAAALWHDGRTLVEACLLAASAFGNGGVVLGKLGAGPGSPVVHLVLLPLAFLGGLGVPVLMESWDRIWRGRAMSRYSRAILIWAAGLYVGGALVLTLVRPEVLNLIVDGLTTGGWTPSEGQQLKRALLSSAAASVNARTAGLPIEYAGPMARTAQWVLLALMAIGANSASTGGGLKVGTFLTLFRASRDAREGKAVPPAAGIAIGWIGTYAAIVVTGCLLLLWLVPEMTTDRLLFLSVSAASNAGLSHDPLSLVKWALVTLSSMMLLGRIVPVLVLWRVARIGDREEEMLVG